MTVETRYNIGDKVWIHTWNKNNKAKIVGIMINALSTGDIIITYSLSMKGCYYKRREADIFSTKEELVNHLK